MPSRALLDGGAPALDLPGGQGGQGLGVALAVGDGFQDVAGGLDPGQARHRGGQLDQGAFQELFQPLPFAGAVADQLQPGAGQVAQRPDLRRRHEAGPQQAHLGEPGELLRVQPVGLRPPGQLPGMGGVDQLHGQPGGLQQVKPYPPVVRCRLHDDQLNPVGEQPPGQRQDLPRCGGDLFQPRRPPPAVAGRGQPGAHVRLRLRDVDPRHPLMPELVVLILHQLRGNLPRPRMTHPGPPILRTGNQAGCPGTRSSGSEAANTDRRAHRRQEATLRSRVPAPGLETGSHPKEARRHGQPAPIVAVPPAPRRPISPHGNRPETAPRSGSDPRHTTTCSPAPNSQGSATAAAIRLRAHVRERPADAQIDHPWGNSLSRGRAGLPGDLLWPSGWRDCIAGFPRRCPGFVPSRGPGSSWSARSGSAVRAREENELEAAASGGRRSGAGKAACGCGLPAVRGSVEWVSIHPFGACLVSGRHDRAIRGRAVSQFFERGVAGQPTCQPGPDALPGPVRDRHPRARPCARVGRGRAPSSSWSGRTDKSPLGGSRTGWKRCWAT